MGGNRVRRPHPMSTLSRVFEGERPRLRPTPAQKDRRDEFSFPPGLKREAFDRRLSCRRWNPFPPWADRRDEGQARRESPLRAFSMWRAAPGLVSQGFPAVLGERRNSARGLGVCLASGTFGRTLSSVVSAQRGV
jgi:hypothetical protein